MLFVSSLAFGVRVSVGIHLFRVWVRVWVRVMFPSTYVVIGITDV